MPNIENAATGLIVLGIFLTIAQIGCMIIPIFFAINNIAKTLTSTERVHKIAKTQLYATLIIDALILYSAASTVICISLLVLQVIVMLVFNGIIKDYKHSYVPYPQHPVPVVNIEKDDCYDIDLSGVTDDTGEKNNA